MRDTVRRASTWWSRRAAVMLESAQGMRRVPARVGREARVSPSKIVIVMMADGGSASSAVSVDHVVVPVATTRDHARSMKKGEIFAKA